MAKKTKKSLREMLLDGDTLSKGLMVSTPLIPKMEILGFVQSEPWSIELAFDDIVTFEPQSHFLCSDRIIFNQKTNIHVVPVFSSVKLETDVKELALDDLYVQRYTASSLYKKIRKRKGGDKKVQVFSYELNRSPMTDHVILKDNYSYYKTSIGEIICLDKDCVIKGVCNEIAVVCRYLHEKTGILNYAMFSVEDLMI